MRRESQRLGLLLARRLGLLSVTAKGEDSNVVSLCARAFRVETGMTVPVLVDEPRMTAPLARRSERPDRWTRWEILAPLLLVHASTVRLSGEEGIGR